MVKGNPIDAYFAVIPVLPALVLLLRLLDNPWNIVKRWVDGSGDSGHPSMGSQLLAYVTMAVLGYFVTARMVPTIKMYTLRKGISGKDLGKRGTSIADKEMYVNARAHL